MGSRRITMRIIYSSAYGGQSFILSVQGFSKVTPRLLSCVEHARRLRRGKRLLRSSGFLSYTGFCARMNALTNLPSTSVRSVSDNEAIEAPAPLSATS